MHVPARRRPEFDAARYYEYPEHLRAAIADMPPAPGVYVFHGADADMPLYIGKSVNLRSRLLSHLRNPDEARRLCAVLAATNDTATYIAAWCRLNHLGGGRS